MCRSASDMEALSSRVRNTNTNLVASAWQGEAANAFTVKTESFRNDFAIYVQNVRTLRSHLSNILSRAESLSERINRMSTRFGADAVHPQVIGFFPDAASRVARKCTEVHNFYDDDMADFAEATRLLESLRTTSFSLSGLQDARSQALHVQIRVSALGRDIVNYGRDVSDLGRHMQQWSANPVNEWGVFTFAFLIGAGFCESAIIDIMNCPRSLNEVLNNRDPRTGAVLLSSETLIGANIMGTLALAVMSDSNHPVWSKFGTAGGPVLSFGMAGIGNLADGKTGFALAGATLVDGSIDLAFAKVGKVIGTFLFPGAGSIAGAIIGLGLSYGFNATVSALLAVSHAPGTVAVSLRPLDTGCHLQLVQPAGSNPTSPASSSGGPSAQIVHSLPPLGTALSSVAVNPLDTTLIPVASPQHPGHHTTATTPPPLMMQTQVHPEGGFIPIPQTGGVLTFD